MASSEHRRQKKLTKKNRRDKEVRKGVVSLKNRSTREIIAETTRSPWVECRVNEMQGMCNVLGLRRNPSGELIMVALLVDKYCLGVKDVTITRDVDWDGYRQWVEGMSGRNQIVAPSYALKLIQGGIDYGRENGFVPHRDTATALSMFADVDPSDCTDEIVFGKDGMPLYSNGPYEDSARINAVIAKLEETRGKGNYHVLLMGGEDRFNRFDEPHNNTPESHLIEDDGEQYDNEFDDGEDSVSGEVIRSWESR